MELHVTLNAEDNSMTDVNEKGHGWIGLVMVVVTGYLIWTSHDSGYEQGREVGIEEGITYASENNEELDICEYTLEEYKTALSEANDNIETANSSMSDAQMYSGATYYEMVDAIDNLQEVETVDEPF